VEVFGEHRNLKVSSSLTHGSSIRADSCNCWHDWSTSTDPCLAALIGRPLLLILSLSSPHQLNQLAHCLVAPLASSPPPGRSQLTSTLAAASLHSYDEAAWTISPAPGAEEVDWSALGLRSWEHALR